MSEKPSKRNWTALNWLNFFAADISDGVGPFLVSKNQSYNHAGNVASAVPIGVVARFTTNAGIFYCMMGFAVFCTISALCIAPKDVTSSRPASQKHTGNKTGLFRELPMPSFRCCAFRCSTAWPLARSAWWPLWWSTI